ncbi:uncharacterized protein LOC128892046 isoform X1 [Hylaeus anthracinus]|uniref:uncharacterized protein LOC128892046 isoform X1 n=1 Tax=Hylaeus anthracinus TaxID=313031 RepID=UPI0023B895C1|nr:uncharacterized protein LOC128892046 isoform X1 [Hylaeus anthracinus]
MIAINSKIVCLCFLLSLGQSINGFDLSNIIDARDTLRFGGEVLMDILESWELIRPRNPGDEDLSYPFVRRMEKEIARQISEVSEKIDNYQDKMEIRIDTIMAKLLTDLPLEERLDHKLRTVDQYLGQINDLYKNFLTYVESQRKYERYTLEDFARTCVSSRSGALPDLLKSIHRIVVPWSEESFTTSILVLLSKQMRDSSSLICNEQQSLQQLLYNLYNTVTLTEIKGYSMIQFSYMLLRVYNPGSNFTDEMDLVTQQYATRTSETVRAVKTAMAFAPRDLWKCDARKQELDETYTKFIDLFQGYIVNEVDLNRESSCRQNCAYYSYAKVQGCYKDQYCAKQRQCNGKILECEYVDSDMWVCSSDRNYDRRYERVQYENGIVYGQKGYCKNGYTKVESWWRWLFWHCSYCFCYCDDHTAKSDRYVSLQSVHSDVANNKVITGIAFKKVNQVIHIEIQEGELLPRGNINKTTVSWKPIEAFNILDKNVKNGIDYHTLAWEERGLDLDDLVPAQDHLLTGVRFRKLGSHLNLEIKVSPFDFITGKLNKPLEKSFWIANDATDRDELKLAKADIPTRLSVPTVPDSKPNQYLNFAPSSRTEDVAQNTIPFIDVQRVESNPPVPIAGAGIFHKGRSMSGGYVALKLITYDFSPHLQVDLGTEQPVIGTPFLVN